MQWRKLGGWTIDCLAISVGIAIATPFFLVLSAPFVLALL